MRSVSGKDFSIRFSNRLTITLVFILVSTLLFFFLLMYRLADYAQVDIHRILQ
jgi:heme/copper-type cytochrome/quinol oxidase subunit 2